MLFLYIRSNSPLIIIHVTITIPVASCLALRLSSTMQDACDTAAIAGYIIIVATMAVSNDELHYVKYRVAAGCFGFVRIFRTVRMDRNE